MSLSVHKVCVVFIAKGEPDTVIDALRRLAGALSALEHIGCAVSTRIVDVRHDERLGEVWPSVDGATISRASGLCVSEAWYRTTHNDAEGAVILIDDTFSDEHVTVVRAVEQLDASPNSDVILPETYSDNWCVVRHRSCIDESIVSDKPSPSTFLERLRLTCRDIHASPERRRVVGPGTASARVELADPNALVVGPNSYFGGGCTVKTWAPSERIEIGAYCSISDGVAFLHPGPKDGSFVDESGAKRQVNVRGMHRPACATSYPLGILLPSLPD